jgi:hypothetical protein
MKLPDSYIHVLRDFNIPLYNLIISDVTSTILELQGGEILAIKWMASAPSTTQYAYIIGYYDDDVFIKINKECSMSRDFVCINEVLFNDITIAFKRDLKIDNILK